MEEDKERSIENGLPTERERHTHCQSVMSRECLAVWSGGPSPDEWSHAEDVECG